MLEEYDLLLRDKVTRISLQLRDAYYKMETKVTDDTSIPLGGEMTESIGAWPEFILRNTFCKRSLQGFCSPCFYSRFPTSNQSRSAYLNMIRMQIFHIIDNFDELVIMRQFSRDSRSERSVSMVLTPTGSFFDEHEFPVKIRLEMERRLVKIAEEKDSDIHLHIESHCEDVNLYD